MRYRRADVTGGTFFFTVNLAERSTDLLTRHVEMLRTVVRRVQHEHPFEIVALIVTPSTAGDGENHNTENMLVVVERGAEIKYGFIRIANDGTANEGR